MTISPATFNADKSRSRVVIIGAGIGGLALANILAHTGYSVDVYEKNLRPGGRAGQLIIDGFTFDTGPSWYLMPEIFEHYFALVGENIEDYLSLTRLNPAYKVFFSGKQPVTISGDQVHDAQAFEKIEPGSSRALARYLAQSEKTYNLAKKYFLYNNFDSLNVLNYEVLKSGPRMAASAFRTIDDIVSKHFKSEQLKQILEYPAVFLGTSPFVAPAIYSLMSYLDFKQGVFYPNGGIYKVIESLIMIGQERGVRYHYGDQVTQILTDAEHNKQSAHRAQVRGIVLQDGTVKTADIVVSNADLHYTETKLLPLHLQSYPERYWSKKTAGPSALLLYLGIKGKLPKLVHHNLLFTQAWHGSFADIFEHKVWPDPASLYVCMPSVTDSSVAPYGQENLFVLVPGPAEVSQENGQLQTLAERYIDQIADMTGISDLRSRIIVQKLYGPQDFVADFNAWHGTALGMSHTLKQSALFRPRNESRKVNGLYYVGSGTVPGIGLPMCLISAETIYKRLINDHTAGPLSVPLSSANGQQTQHSKDTM